MPESREYKLNINPRILELLGPNLYTNIYYVLAELIANAYDADARNVYIISNRDDITVEDDGHGMSYSHGDIDNYLNVAKESRHNNEDSTSKSGKRMKMGRKGVGKLAALSVSENVDILTVAENEKSGFILSRKPGADNILEGISDDKITFDYIESHGSAIIMRNPQYRLHKTLTSIKRNLLKIFPLIDSTFKVHIIRGTEKVVIDDFDKSIMNELCSLITLGERFSHLQKLIPVEFDSHHEELVTNESSKSFPLSMKDRNGEEHEYLLEIEGWIGTYKTTKGRKAVQTDFPDNFISLLANNKMGEFNILPIVGKNKLPEVYVVGQLHINLFELSELPDMALSNRQGYKSDDPRYETVIKYVRDDLLINILKKRSEYANYKNQKKREEDEQNLENKENELKKSVNQYKKKVSSSAANRIKQFSTEADEKSIQNVIEEVMNESNPDIGLKTVIDSLKKKILISHTYKDKPLADTIYQMLLFNNVPKEDILYTNCDDEVCRVPDNEGVYNYLRKFFVDSYSTNKIFIIFVTSEFTKESWGAITEVGACWITQIDNRIFNIRPFRPEHPLNDEAQWQTTSREHGELYLDKLNCDIFCQKIEAICDKLGYSKKVRDVNSSYLETIIAIR